ncbi:hypothetical protein [Apilactobacillus xinyiensis]|uniref:Uncharacterized protein n=1 Tax=Apilactobacillus xinyiensis TaxID=2841032 RepID=A0ABT0HZE2_9LACO|nr:hypothetical protein [Apilactobacillus xinyiensis]MCK8623941.1 hypothetical protein [Apilactobacillus xinyiensis]MCL0311535.1 hypothetical protein [Apilactobacillus xinyiensis]MCL0318321.1 hypothetical protein [Apilactobacillus xinyiensis]MCL0330087.1 hypothetical protein [Apilactobacillus xinyiensis]
MRNWIKKSSLIMLGVSVLFPVFSNSINTVNVSAAKHKHHKVVKHHKKSVHKVNHNEYADVQKYNRLVKGIDTGFNSGVKDYQTVGLSLSSFSETINGLPSSFTEPQVEHYRDFMKKTYNLFNYKLTKKSKADINATFKKIPSTINFQNKKDAVLKIAIIANEIGFNIRS